MRLIVIHDCAGELPPLLRNHSPVEWWFGFIWETATKQCYGIDDEAVNGQLV